FFFQAEDGIRDFHVTGVQTCALPISSRWEALAEAAGKFRPRPRAGPGKPAAKPTATLATGPRPMSRAGPRSQTGLAPAANRPGPGGKPTGPGGKPTGPRQTPLRSENHPLVTEGPLRPPQGRARRCDQRPEG